MSHITREQVLFILSEKCRLSVNTDFINFLFDMPATHGFAIDLNFMIMFHYHFR